jgi:hypothetical protein
VYYQVEGIRHCSRAYDLIIGMDWLAAHRALVDCFAKRVLCVDDEGRPVEIQGV